MSGYREWLSKVQADAELRGAKPINRSRLAALGEDYRRWRRAQARDVEHLYIAGRKPGEIANPITGEIITECVTIGRLAQALTVTADNLTDEMVKLDFVQRVLDYREIPMVSQPAFRKPMYFLTPQATRYGVDEGFVIPIKISRHHRVRELMLITPKGQGALRDVVSLRVAPRSKPDNRRALITGLLIAGYCQAEIARLTSIPRQTVSRHALAFWRGESSLSHFP